MKRLLFCAIAMAFFGLPSMAGSPVLEQELDRFFTAEKPMRLELRPEHVLQPNVAVLYFDTGESSLQMEIALTDELIARLPLQVTVDPNSFGYFVGRFGHGDRLEILDRSFASSHLANPTTAKLCGNRVLMAEGELGIPSESVWIDTKFGFGTTSRAEAAAAEIGIFSATCGLSVANCPNGKSCFWGTGECGVGVDPFGNRWCACFI